MVGTSTSFLHSHLSPYAPSADCDHLSQSDIYWLCNDENRLDVPKGYYTEKTRIREGLAIAVALGANTIRVISCGTSVGYKYAIEPKVGSFSNAEAVSLGF